MERERAQAKFWLDPVRLHASVGFGRVELARIETAVAEQHDRFLGAWRDYFSD